MYEPRNRRQRRMLQELLEARCLLTGFTAYNAFFASPNQPDTTTTFADRSGYNASGNLIDIVTGEQTSARVTASNSGSRIGGNGTRPAAGTPAADRFTEHVDFTSAERRSIEVWPGSSYDYTFENLDAGAMYSFSGTAIRGNANYTDRWTLVEVLGAESVVPDHSTGSGIYSTGLNANQIAFWTGDNSQSDQGWLVGWKDIDPGPDGQFQVVSSHYTGPVPGGGRATGTKGYALSAFELTEQAPAGPPVVANAPATQVTATTAVAGGEIVSTGGQLPEVKIYYGTADGGTNPASWQHVVDVEAAVQFETLLDNLAEGTRYFYRAFAEHSLGSDWADSSGQFTTLIAGPPQISTLPAEDVGAQSAEFRGMVTDTGNDPPSVMLFYGTSNGGSNPLNWQHSVDLGTYSGAVSHLIQGLQQQTTYYYALHAVNANGQDWGLPAASFTTPEIPPLLINELMADNTSTLQTRVRTSATQAFVGDPMTPDWIEIRTTQPIPFDLSGYYLTDDLGSLQQWQFPDGTMIPANGRLVVYASGFNIKNPALDETGRLHTNFRLRPTAGADLAIVAPDGTLQVELKDMPAQLRDVSYGIGAQGETRFFTTATPGRPNDVQRPVAPQISQPSQTFTDTVTVQLTSDASSARIYYTTDGRRPTNLSTRYTQPLTFQNSTMLRAIAIGPNGDESIIVSESYIKLSSQVRDAQSHLPLLIVDTFGDGIPGGKTFGDSFVGIIEPGDDGVSQLTDDFDLTTRAGIHVRGSSSSGFAKKQFRVEFRDEYDEDRQLKTLGMPREADWIFYGPSVFDRVLISNPLMYDLSNQIGRYATRTRWVEAYMDGRYHGVYAIMEVIERDDDRVDVERLSTGSGGQPVEGGFIWKRDRGSAYVDPEIVNTAQRRYIDNTMNQLRTAAASQHFKDPNIGYAAYADVGSFIDHNILNLLAMNVDALRLSSFYYKTAEGKIQAGPIWDFDRSLDSTDGRDNNASSWFGTGDSTRYFDDSSRVMTWWPDMFQDPDFVQQYIDRWTELRQNELSNENLFATIDKHAAELGEAADRDYARWSASRYGDFAGEIRHLKNWLRQRVEWIDSQWLSPPRATVAAEDIGIGTSLRVISGDGQVYYMTDGTDPRGEDGAIRPEANRGNGPIVFGADTHVVARVYARNHGGNNGYVRSGDDWSAPLQLTPARAAADASNLTISEIHYNPADADVLGGEENADNDEFEFLEITNVGTAPVELGGVRLVEVDVDGDTQGVRFTFANQVLDAGASIVVVENVKAFQSRYGDQVPIALGRDEPGDTSGQYGGKLSNGGERLTLLAADGQLIRQVDYQDDWYPQTDGDGKSLVNRRLMETDPATLSQATSWAASGPVDGTPGTRPVANLPGDFDGDGVRDVTDLDLLYAAIGDPAADDRFDLNQDQQVDRQDVEYLVTQLIQVPMADANLDGVVNFTDFLVLSQNFGSEGEVGWGNGDFDADGKVNFTDFLVLSRNFGN